MNIFERRYKALRILIAMPVAAYTSICEKLGWESDAEVTGADYDAFADKLADLFDITIGVSHAAPWFVLERTPEGWKVNTPDGQLPPTFFNADLAYTAAIRHLGGTFKRVAKSDGYMRYQSTAIDAGCVYVGPGEGVVIEPNRGHPTPEPVWFSMRKTPFGWTVLANGSIRLGSREHEVEAFAAACSYFNRDPDDFQVRHKDGNTYYEYEAKR